MAAIGRPWLFCDEGSTVCLGITQFSWLMLVP